MKKITIIFSIICLLLILCGIYFYFENTTLEVSTYQIASNKIPNEFNNYKIIQISDFHNNTSSKLTKKLIAEIKNQKPNIIVITGDLIDSTKTNVDIAIDMIKEIIEIAPVYYVTGNHEARTNEYDNLKSQMIELGVKILENEAQEIQLNNSTINILGINDTSFNKERDILDSEIVKSNMENIRYNEDDFTILLSHRPEVFKIYVEKNIDLVFTGHAHGGQIRLPFIGGIIAPNQGAFPEYTDGIYREKDTTMVVSRGIGNSIIPFRVNNRPELVIVELINWG